MTRRSFFCLVGALTAAPEPTRHIVGTDWSTKRSVTGLFALGRAYGKTNAAALVADSVLKGGGSVLIATADGMHIVRPGSELALINGRLRPRDGAA